MKPKAYQAVMVSSTFSDLKDHRRAVIDAIEKLGFHAKVMESSGARADTDVIDTSLDMVRDSAAFVGVISHRYGQTPVCPDRNPDALSVSELEFNEAMRLGRPILLFIMGDEHPGTRADFESDPEKLAKLQAFRKRAKRMREGSEVERIYEVFNSLEQFAAAAATAVGRLSQSLPPQVDDAGTDTDDAKPVDPVETARPPDLRAAPRYLGSHRFIGRAAELDALDDWCAAADPNPMLLFEAIGGSGKSMVTWTWLTGRALEARDDWAGRFWYSFYEGGATMDGFCRAALAYMTGRPIKTLYKQNVRTLMPSLLAELEARPWLLVLDGLERILVAYHRIDAPQMRDEDVDDAEDQISNRDPRAAIHPQDEELLRRLTDAAPSKILVTSRLTPQALMNKADMPLPGVRREPLSGLRPPDAEALFRACGVFGESKAMRAYLQSNCDCHPLVIGALAGLVNNYMAARGDFDAWLADPAAGGRMGLADLDLTQRRNHILDAAIADLPDPARRLLQTLSLLQGGADYATLKAFNPHLPPPPENVEEPEPPEKRILWRSMTLVRRAEAIAQFETSKKAHEDYLSAREAWERSPEVHAAPGRLDDTIKALEDRGLLQYERGLKRYDLHPVVRGVTAGRMSERDTGAIGGQVVDHFSSRQHSPWTHAEKIEDLAPGIQLVITLTKLQRLDEAILALNGALTEALVVNLMARREMQALLRPLFYNDWGIKPEIDSRYESVILNWASQAIYLDDPLTGINLESRALTISAQRGLTKSTLRNLINLGDYHMQTGNVRGALRVFQISRQYSNDLILKDGVFLSTLSHYSHSEEVGEGEKAEALWASLNPMGRDWQRQDYPGGSAEVERAKHLLHRGELTVAWLSTAEALCKVGRNRQGLCDCLTLRGRWFLSSDEAEQAIEPLSDALRLYREAGQDAPETEAFLTLARLRAGGANDAMAVAERLDNASRHEAALAVAELWQALGERDRAVDAALRAHKSACGSGEPYVFRYYLDRADALLRDLGETPPPVPVHDPSTEEPFEWEDDLNALIEEERQKRERAKAEREE